MGSVYHYKVVIIIDPSQNECAVDPSLEGYLDVARRENGKVEKVDIQGKHHLADPVKKKKDGIYITVDLACESVAVLGPNCRLSLNDSILHTKVLRADH